MAELEIKVSSNEEKVERLFEEIVALDSQTKDLNASLSQIEKTASVFEGLQVRVASLADTMGTSNDSVRALFGALWELEKNVSSQAESVRASLVGVNEAVEEQGKSFENTSTQIKVASEQALEYSRRMSEVAQKTSYEGAGQSLPLLVKQLEEVGREILESGDNAEEARRKLSEYVSIYSQINDITISGKGAGANELFQSIAQAEDVINSFVANIKGIDLNTALDYTQLSANISLVREVIAGTGISFRTFAEEVKSDGSAVQTELENNSAAISAYIAQIQSQQTQADSADNEAKQKAIDAILNSQRAKLDAFRSIADSVEEQMQNLGSRGNVDVFANLVEQVSNATEALSKQMPMMNSIVQKEAEGVMQTLNNLEDRLGNLNQFNELQMARRSETTNESTGGIISAYGEYQKLTEQRINMKVTPDVDTSEVDKRIAELRKQIEDGAASASMSLDNESKAIDAAIKKEEESISNATAAIQHYQSERAKLNAKDESQRTDAENTKIQKYTQAIEDEKKALDEATQASEKYKERKQEIEALRQQVSGAISGSSEQEFENARQAADGMNIYKKSLEETIELHQKLTDLQEARKEVSENGGSTEMVDARIAETMSKLQEAGQNASLGLQTSMDAARAKLDEYQTTLAELTQKQEEFATKGDYTSAFALNDAISETKAKIDELTTSYGEQSVKLQELQQELAVVNSERLLNDGQYGSLVGDIDSDLEKIRELRDKLYELREEKATASSGTGSSGEADATGGNIDIDTQIEATKALLDSLVDGVSVKFEAANSIISSGIEDIQARYETAMQSLSQAKDELAQATISGDDSKIAAAQEQYNQAKESVKEYAETLAELKEQKDSLDQSFANEAYSANAASIDELKAKSEELIATIAQQKEELSNMEVGSDGYDELRASIESNLSAAQAAMQSYVAKQEQQLGTLRSELSELIQKKEEFAQAGNTEGVEEMNSLITEQNELIKEQISELRESSDAYAEFINKNQEYADIIGTATQVVSEKNNTEVQNLGTLSELIQKNEGLKGIFDLMPKSIQGILGKMGQFIKLGEDGLPSIALTAKAASASIGGMTKAAMGFIATPVGAVIAAIVAVVYAMKKAIESSAEGQVIWNKVMAVCGSVMSSLMDIIVAFGMVAIKHMKLVGQALWDLWDLLTTTLFNFYIWKGFTNAISLLFQGEFSAAKDAFVNGFSEGFDTIKTKALKVLNNIKKNGVDLGNSVVNAVKVAVDKIPNIIRDAEGALRNSQEQTQLNKEKREGAIEQAKKTAEVQRLRTEMMGETDNKKKLELANEAIKLEEEIGNKEIEWAERQAKITTEQVQRHTTDLKALQQVADANMNVFKAQQAQARSLRMLVRQRKTAIKAIENEAKQASKKAAADAKKAAAEAKKNFKQHQEEMAQAAKAAAEEAANAWKMEKYYAKRLRQAEDGEMAIMELKANLLKDGFEKEQAMRDLNHKKEMLQLERQAEDARDAAIEHLKKEFEEKEKAEEKRFNTAHKNTGEKYQVKTFDYDSEEAQAAGESAYNEVIKQSPYLKQKQLQEDEKALDDLLSNYEDFTTKKYLLEKQFNEKIASLRAARAKAEKDGKPELVAMYSNAIQEEIKNFNNELGSLEQGEFFKNNNLEKVFSDMASMSKEALQNARELIKQRIESGEVNSVQDLELLSQKAKEIEDVLFNRESKIYNLIGGGLMNALNERARLTQKTVDAEAELAALYEKQKKAQSDIFSAQDKVMAVAQSAGVSLNARDIQSTDREAIVKQLRENGATDDIVKAILEAFDKLQRAEKEKKDTDNDVDSKESSLKFLQKWNKDRRKNEVDSAVDWASGQAQGMVALTDKLKAEGVFGNDPDSEVADKISAAFSSAAKAGEAYAKFMQGDFVGAASAALDSVLDLLKVFGVGEGNMKELQKEIDHLTSATADLSEAFDKLKDNLDKATTATAKEAYEKAKANLEQRRENTKKTMQDRLRQWERGSSSLKTKVNRDKDAQQALRQMGLSSVEELTRLTSQQLQDLQTQFAGGAWTTLMEIIRKRSNEHNGDGEAFIEELNLLAGFEDEAEEIENIFNEKITGISFDSMFDSFKSTLKDMKSSSEDFAAALEKDLNDAIINSIGDKYKEKLNDWYKDWSKKQERWTAMAKDGLTDSEKAVIEMERGELEKAKEQIVQQAIDERNNLRDSGIITEEVQNRQGATRGFEAMSSEQANELNGRFTALQVSNQGILNTAAQQLEQESLLNVTMMDIAEYTKDMSISINSLLDIQANAYLELQEINSNTAKAANFFQAAMPSIEKLNTIAEKL